MSLQSGRLDCHICMLAIRQCICAHKHKKGRRHSHTYIYAGWTYLVAGWLIWQEINGPIAFWETSILWELDSFLSAWISVLCYGWMACLWPTKIYRQHPPPVMECCGSMRNMSFNTVKGALLSSEPQREMTYVAVDIRVIVYMLRCYREMLLRICVIQMVITRRKVNVFFVVGKM